MTLETTSPHEFWCNTTQIGKLVDLTSYAEIPSDAGGAVYGPSRAQPEDECLPLREFLAGR